MKEPTILLFRNDLRLLDNPALRFAVETNKPIFFVYIHDSTAGSWRPGAASCWWLYYSLQSLQKDLASFNASLYLFSGSQNEIIARLVSETAASQVICNRRYEPEAIKQDDILKSQLAEADVRLDFAQGNLLFPPGSILNKQGEPYKVFTPFYKACRETGLPSQIISKPKKIIAYKYNKTSLRLSELGLLPKVKWDSGFHGYWQPGENGAHQRLKNFIKDNVISYSTQRDFPLIDSTSHLSPYLHFGEISPQRIIYLLTQAKNKNPKLDEEAEKVMRQLVWREFAYHILYSFPFTSDEPFQAKFKYFPWKRSDNKVLSAWQKGQTGYPIVDAGMRELWHTGYMHNRVRMIVASFLTKNGLLHWKKGALWFWDTLVDADLAQNSMNWQWVAGCGVDAAPYFRIFNPVTQSKRFDAKGNYIRRWCPELIQLPDKYIHSPSIAPAKVLQEANVKLGVDYPSAILDLSETRERALSLFKDL